MNVSSTQDQARVIAERVARRLAAGSADRGEPSSPNGAEYTENRRARMINFVSSTPPPRTQPSIGAQPDTKLESPEPRRGFVPHVAQSPWLMPFAASLDMSSKAEAYPQSEIRNSQIVSHPSQERFAVEEAAVSELVEFFENEKKCSVDPSGKPCDHCAMCSSRGF